MFLQKYPIIIKLEWKTLDQTIIGKILQGSKTYQKNKNTCYLVSVPKHIMGEGQKGNGDIICSLLSLLWRYMNVCLYT